MNFGFDAKRAFHNGTGLGHYSRNLVGSLSKYFPEHNYYLFNPKRSHLFQIEGRNITEVRPTGLNSFFPSYWRTKSVIRDLKKKRIDIYHGLSHELPVGIQNSGIKSVVTMHDLIHERYPDQYNPLDVRIYRKKFRHACAQADRIIAISEQTRRDLVSIYNVHGDKIDVCYQSCNPSFYEKVPEFETETVRKLLDLPAEYFLYVGSIIERKNLLTLCKAMRILRKEIEVPLVVIGDGTSYKQRVKDYVRANELENRVIFLSERNGARNEPAFRTAKMFPAIYQSALAMIYPSTFEGFGIPVLEALCSKLPVITSNVSSLPEAGGPAAIYVEPHNEEEIALAMRKIYNDPLFADQMRMKGSIYAEKFRAEKTSSGVMEVYKKLKSDGF